MAPAHKATNGAAPVRVRGPRTKQGPGEAARRLRGGLLPFSVELEGVEDGWPLLPQVPQVDAVVGQRTHQRPLKGSKEYFTFDLG